MNSAYFEHAFLARQMGVELVEPSDLVVRDAVCYMRTTAGLQRVHTIYRRLDDSYIDPLEFRPDSVLGVPGLVRAYRAGTVAIANAIGTGVADDKAIYYYVPEMIRFYLGEEPILDNVPTYLLANESERSHVLGRLSEVVVKPTSESGGKGVFIGPQATAAELEEQKRLIEHDPSSWIAQELVHLSTAPTDIEGHLEPRHVDLRPSTPPPAADRRTRGCSTTAPASTRRPAHFRPTARRGCPTCATAAAGRAKPSSSSRRATI
jgi:uncharacterized circularly permuted ATP-grasp superfamily protein